MSTSAGFGSEARGEFLARVSAGLGRSKASIVEPPTPAPELNEAVARVVDASADLPQVFSNNATKSGMQVHRTTAADAASFALDLLARLGAKRVAVGGTSVLQGVKAGLAARGMEALDWAAELGLGALYPSDAGVTDVQAAIAETGTLVCWSGRARGRGLSLVPPLHVAIVKRSDIVPDLIDYLARHKGQGPAELVSSMVLITGPSKTADIEGVLITGVHGPREVHIVMIDDA